MPKGKPRNRALRALVTEVLPHELPLIFTNDFLYLSHAEQPVDLSAHAHLQSIRTVSRAKKSRFTKPYEFAIRKDRSSSTRLSIMHPLSQMVAAQFYDDFAETIIASCAVSPASLRRPTAVAKLATPNDLIEPSADDGNVHVEVSEEEEELAKIVSFFVYRDINLLAKFFDSSAYISLEKQFSRLRMVDVSKCFYSIYTHSVTWAVKNKDFAKDNSGFYAFEQRFDTLMQRHNFNETNGILVGPELSRIFAEIIFQRIDLNVIAMAAEEGLHYGKDYEFKRYVDDYFIYANDEINLDVIQEILDREISFYKMYLNEGKEKNLSRPFVTPLSLAKREIHRTFYELKAVVDEARRATDPKLFRGVTRKVKAKTLEARLIIGEHGIGFHNVSGWALSLLRAMVFELVESAAALKDDDDERAACIERALWSLLTLVFYVVSLDVRVNTTYALAQILSIVGKRGYKKIRDSSDWIEHVMLKETIDLMVAAHGAFFRHARRRDSIECFNILIIGAQTFGKLFTRNFAILEIIQELLVNKLSYFSYITLKFVFLKDPLMFSTELDQLNKLAAARIRLMRDDLAKDTEAYLLLADFMSAPDISKDQKRSLWKDVLSGEPSNAHLDYVASRCGFVDWTGIRIGHLIARQRLRPVYE
ncbi:antiviral reverse transcriptase Drt3b [Novosphingobium sp. B-7]|uniref:antiviral reverse transcriptase Drt3b n=1 Tax=Novosphingobium sp. B-7 TaxID=1298855 RepID=UPI00040F16DB|nr:antiviral reverse transcriptase Drt3b [Novosphingobium sp. B-7]